MEIISHRGYWKTAEEKNTAVAFERSFKLGFGTETDLRDLDGTVVVSHDMPSKALNPLTFDDLLTIYTDFSSELPLALNIKADGLQDAILKSIRKHNLSCYYLFDMTIPDLRTSLNKGLSCLTRQSEYEPQPSLYNECQGVWLDEFAQEWITSELIQDHTREAKKAFIVSPELHGRPHEARWNFYSSLSPELRKNCTLCTDIPEAAQTFFNY